MMDIDELRNLYTKLVYQETLDLDDDGARYILQDLVGDEINRLRLSTAQTVAGKIKEEGWDGNHL